MNRVDVDFKRNGKPNHKPESRDKSTILLKKSEEKINRMIGDPI